MRPILRPGVRLLRRDRHSWQLGLDWPGAAVVADSPALRAVTSSLDGVREHEGVLAAAVELGPDAAECEQTLAALIERGLVVDGDERRPPDVSEQAWAAWSMLAGRGSGPAQIARARRERVVAVEGSGAVAGEVRRLMPRSGVSLSAVDGVADLVVLVSDVESDRSAADRALHTGLPHLWASVRDCVGLVGPFVLPGETACLRCADAARADVDPAWPTLLAAATRARPVIAPVDGVLTALLGALVVHEVAVWASGLGPQTLNAVVEIPYGFGPVQRAGLAQHPRCGCGWPTWQDTMGA